MKLIGAVKVDVSPKNRPNGGKGIQTTTSMWDKGEYTRGVFEMKFDFGGKTPSAANNWLLEDNPWYVPSSS